MLKNIAVVVLYSYLAYAQGADSLTNETIIKMVQAGVPSAAIIKTIVATEYVSFKFLSSDLGLLQRANVSDDVIKAMAAKDRGLPVTDSSPAMPTAVVPAQPARDLGSVPLIPGRNETTPEKQSTQAQKPNVAPTFAIRGPAPVAKKGRAVKIHGYVTAVQSPTEFEIDEYRISKNSSVVLELEKSEDPDEATTFNADEIHVGTEMEIRGDLDPATNQLTANSIKINLDEHRRVKRTALLEVTPNFKRVGNVWEGQLHVDGQSVIVNESTAVTIKPNNTQKKAAKISAKVTQRPKDSEAEVEDDDELGVALNRMDQIRGNTFVSYEGIRQKDGTILARKVEFTENELTSGEARLWKTLKPKVKQPSLAGGKPGELSIQQVGKFKLVPNAEVQAYVRQLGMSLVPRFQRDMPSGDPQKIDFQFFVVEQKVPNAFALPNGIVIVNSGIITMLENEAQLAAVLGHEISHATEEHTYRQQQYHKKSLMALRIGGAVGAAYGGRAIADLANLTEAAIRNGYNRSLENQADRVGMEYMQTAGYDPREAARVWKVMALKNGDHPTNLFWSNHDNHTTRRSYLMAELKNNYSNADFASYKRDTEEFAATVSSLNTLYAPKANRNKAK